MKITVLLLILLIYSLANYYIFHRIWVAMPPNTILRVILIVIAVVVVSSFFLAASLGEKLPIPLTSALYVIGSSWLFIAICFVLVFLFQDLILLANKALNFMPSKVILQFSKDNWVGLLFTIGFITMLMLGGYFRYLWKDRVYLPIQLSKPIGDSISKKALRIVAISDLHLGYTIKNDELEKWVSLINNEKPDIILIAGDVIDNSVRPLEEANTAAILKKLDAPMGVYACMGNHEYIGGDQGRSLSFYNETGIHLLRDDYALVDSLFYVIGRDDKSNSKRKSLSDLLKGLDRTKPMILLDHQPYDLHVAEENGVDLQISGHTHKGQIWPVSIITKMLYEIDHGYLKKGNTHIYVSSGIGIWGGKFRIGTRSEFVVMDINKEEK